MASWTTPVIHVTGDVLTASDWNINSNDLSFLSGAAAALVVTSQSTASTTYTDLATVGPAVTLTTGTTALVTVSCNLNNNTSGAASAMAWAVSGASTYAANDVNAIVYGQQATVSFGIQASSTTPAIGLTPGSNTFTAKYHVTGGTGSYQLRWITVQPLP